ncbi:hypothetical protein [Clostridium sp.]|uniref:hypothetical protein n=1 Tax=Clostridium sp. TaxID=1506 RepID=UPI003995B39B
MKKKILNSKILVGMLLVDAVTSTGTTALAASWGGNLPRWSTANEISTITKSTANETYHMKVNSVGGSYDSLKRWIENWAGSNKSIHTITQEGRKSNPKSSASKGSDVVLNIQNPINFSVNIAALGQWSPN